MIDTGPCWNHAAVATERNIIQVSDPHGLDRCVSISMVFFGGPAVYVVIDNMALLMAICYC